MNNDDLCRCGNPIDYEFSNEQCSDCLDRQWEGEEELLHREYERRLL